MDWDDGNIYVSNQQLGVTRSEATRVGTEVSSLSVSAARRKFRDFIRNFRSGNRFLYRETLLQNYRKSIYYLEVSLSDLNSYDENLQEALRKEPSKFIGELVMNALAEIDNVAYIRYASVYRNFREASDFGKFVEMEIKD